MLMMGVGASRRSQRLYVHKANFGGHSIFVEQAGRKSQSALIEVVALSDSIEYAGGYCDLQSSTAKALRGSSI